MVPLKDWRKRGWGTGREGDKKQEFGFSGFGHVKCEISTLLTHGKKKNNKKNVGRVSGIQRKSLSWRWTFRNQWPQDGR